MNYDRKKIYRYRCLPMPREYRIGDAIIFNGWLLREEGGVFDIQREMLTSYPDSIAAAFITEARRQNFTCACYEKLDHCASILKTVTDRECPARLGALKRTDAVVAPVVVHVRTADVISQSGVADSEDTGRPAEFYDKLAGVMRDRGIKRATLITSYQHKTQGNHDGPRLFVKNVQESFRRAGVDTNVLITDDPDTDFCTMLSAPVFVPSRSGMSELAAEASLLNGNEVIGLWRRDDPISVDLGVFNPRHKIDYLIKWHPWPKPGWFDKLFKKTA
jgi:hypothetical protein